MGCQARRPSGILQRLIITITIMIASMFNYCYYYYHYYDDYYHYYYYLYYC